MNDSTNTKHVWSFPKKGLKALFDNEITGQLSDGAWENTVPYEHWRFWCNLKTEVNAGWGFRFGTRGYSSSLFPKKKTAYNLVGELVTDCDLSDRMRAYYIAAEADLGLKEHDASYFVGYNGPLTADQVRKDLVSYKSEWHQKKLAELEANSLETTCAMMKAGWEVYTKKDLVNDLKTIKAQMKVVISHFHS